MDYIEKISDTVSVKGKEVAGKAKEVAQITRLKNQMRACQKVINNNYKEIGKMFYEENIKNPDAPYEKQRIAIKNAQRAIFELEEQIEALKSES